MHFIIFKSQKCYKYYIKLIENYLNWFFLRFGSRLEQGALRVGLKKPIYIVKKSEINVIYRQ